ncbi:MAG: phosphodiesterase [Gammaproteobacteria bacterium]
MRNWCRLLLALGALAVTCAAAADVLSIEANVSRDVARPARGMSMARVVEQFGTPIEKYPAVGKPPITRWDYDNFSVFFEYQHVVHAVAKHPLNAPAN